MRTMMMHRCLVAWVVCLSGLAVGCPGAQDQGDDVGPAPDAPGGGDPDGGIDAPIPETGTASVTVLPDRAGDPVAGVQVVFAAQDGTVLGVETTDAGGKAAHTVTQDASITIVRGTGTSRRMQTRLAVQPGDALRFGSINTPLPKIATMRVSWPNAGAGYRYDVETPCGGSNLVDGTSAMISFDNRCASGTVDISVMKVSVTSYEVLGYLSKPAQTIVDGGSISVSGTYVVPPAMTGTFATPIGTRLVGNMFETYAQRRFYLDTDRMQSASTDGMGSLAYKLPPAPGSELHHEVIVHRADGVTQVVARRLPYTTQVGFDVGAQLIQWVTDASFSPATRTLSWTPEAGGAPDLVLVLMHYNHGSAYNTWVVIGPPASTVTVPTLPAALATYDIGTSDVVQGELALLRVGKPFAAVAGEAGVFLARDTSDTVDWLALPADVDRFSMSFATF